ncbi:SPOR domain-containing protein [Castellaniella sp. GW247-6E4]|uniref:SPOR domain-containing protein n=1 Tax=Castellaniella sp. GW247-6E4 TaxID=3140380 RepID=UPI003316451A
MFFRKATDSASERRTSARGAGSSEAQLKELRNKARRRLIGALALVLAAVIVVPPLFDAPPELEPREPIVVPASSSGLVTAPGQDLSADAGQATEGDAAETAPATEATQAQTPAEPATPPESTEPAGQPAQEADKIAEASRPPAASEARPAAPPPKPGPGSERTDDGSVALALLAGKMPADTGGKAQRPVNPPKAQGSFILQVAAYTTEQDARQRRDGLIESGVTNAYVERGQSGDKTVYRLRVGPFPTHEAAQAAQTRLRALGYQNGLISGK